MQKDIHLERPLVIYDVETTGVDPGADRITQIAAIKLNPGDSLQKAISNLKDLISKGSQQVAQENLVYCTINPEMRVKPHVLELTHLTQDLLDKSHNFRKWSSFLYKFFTESYVEGRYYDTVDVAGYNNNRFDNEMLTEEFKRVGLDLNLDRANSIDAFSIYIKKNTRTLEDAYKFYCKKDMSNAHDALSDIAATAEVMLGQLNMYEDLETDVKSMSEYGRREDWVDKQGKFIWEGEEVLISFSKHAGTSLREMVEKHVGFLKWMLDNRFPKDTLSIVQNALNGVYPKAPKKEGT